MKVEDKTVYIVGVDHRIQYTNAECGPEWAAELQKFEDYLVGEAKRCNVDLLAEEFNEELVRHNRASGCTVQDAAQRIGKLHLFCDPDSIERKTKGISNSEQREKEWLLRIERTKSHRVLMACGNSHIESFTKRLQSAGFAVTVLSRDWGSNWMFMR